MAEHSGQKGRTEDILCTVGACAVSKWLNIADRKDKPRTFYIHERRRIGCCIFRCRTEEEGEGGDVSESWIYPTATKRSTYISLQILISSYACRKLRNAAGAVGVKGREGRGGKQPDDRECKVLSSASQFSWRYKYPSHLRKRKSPAFHIIEPYINCLSFLLEG